MKIIIPVLLLFIASCAANTSENDKNILQRDSTPDTPPVDNPPPPAVLLSPEEAEWESVLEPAVNLYFNKKALYIFGFGEGGGCITEYPMQAINDSTFQIFFPERLEKCDYDLGLNKKFALSKNKRPSYGRKFAIMKVNFDTIKIIHHYSEWMDSVETSYRDVVFPIEWIRSGHERFEMYTSVETKYRNLPHQEAEWESFLDPWINLEFDKKILYIARDRYNGCVMRFPIQAINDSTFQVFSLKKLQSCEIDMGFAKKFSLPEHQRPIRGKEFAIMKLTPDTIHIIYDYPEWINSIHRINKFPVFPTCFPT